MNEPTPTASPTQDIIDATRHWQRVVDELRTENDALRVAMQRERKAEMAATTARMACEVFDGGKPSCESDAATLAMTAALGAYDDARAATDALIGGAP